MGDGGRVGVGRGVLFVGRGVLGVGEAAVGGLGRLCDGFASADVRVGEGRSVEGVGRGDGDRRGFTDALPALCPSGSAALRLPSPPGATVRS
ncbi:hypothetical protein G5C51_17540 [Streptomyces sp. A7024]|uniref:Uncharacterized protein n=1 Tax=Streptomyces coryli TaxID=1128680 RepID=A0A6G4U329_9ACTN|nr:hypothetical protein [Streptomyces coryli]NGN65697.1 hypothetical protein [Streptomyces coryli]